MVARVVATFSAWPAVNSSVRTNCEKMLIGPDVPPAVDKRWGGERALADLVDVHQLKRRTGPQYERLAVVVREDNFSVHGDR